MARGSSYGDNTPLPPISVTPHIPVTRRATRDLQAINEEEEPETQLVPVRETGALTSTYYYRKEHPLARHRTWLTRLLICIVLIVLGALVLASAAMYQRPGASQLVSDPSVQSFPIQVGGSVDAFNTWQNSSGPIVNRKPIPVHTGPYSVLGKPTISADFINQVLASYHSPAAGKGQTLYNFGVKYGIDPVYPLAFFMNESLFGTTGEAQVTLSLGNSRCITTRPCIDKNIGGFAQMYSWEDGFEQWYKLIRNLYIAQWGFVTIDQIVPTYTGESGQGYIAALKHEINTWRAGILRP